MGIMWLGSAGLLELLIATREPTTSVLQLQGNECFQQPVSLEEGLMRRKTAAPTTALFQPNDTLSRVSSHAVKLWNNTFVSFSVSRFVAIYYTAVEYKCKVRCVLWYHSPRLWNARPNMHPHSGYSGISKKRPSNSICLYSYCLYLFLFFYWQLSWIVFVFCFLAKLFHIYVEHIFDICVYKITVPFLCSKHYDKCFVGIVKSSQQPCCTVEITKAWSR